MTVVKDTGQRATLPPFSEEHEELRETVRRFVQKEIAPNVDEWEEAREFPRDDLAHAAVAAEDEVVSELVEHACQPLPLPPLRPFSFGEQAHEQRERKEERAHAGEQDDDRPCLAGARHAVHLTVPDRRHRDDGHVERIPHVPTLDFDIAEGADDDDDKEKGDRQAGPGSASVALELQADCFAGIWGHTAAQNGRFNAGGVELEPGDAAEALRAAASIGDDRLQRMATGRVMPERFTHGTSAQRVEWFRRGMESGDPRVCSTGSTTY